MKISAAVNGRDVELETFPDLFSPGVTKGILAGETYAIVPGLHDVRTILDVGANLGAASILFACHYPEAIVHSFEPAPATFELLIKNTAPFPSVVPHNFGLFDETSERELYRGKGSPGEASLYPQPWVSRESDTVAVRDARSWVDEHGLDHIDILKVDTEGCELPILHSLAELVPRTQVVYLECHSKQDWREVDEMLSPTHEVMAGKFLFENAEITYVSKEIYRAIRERILAGYEASN